MDTSEYDRQQPWLLKFEDPPQLHVSTSQAYPWAPSKIPILPNSQTLQEVTGMTYGPNTDDPEGDDKVQPWLISDAPIQSCKPHPPLSQDPVLWDDYVSSCDWDRGNKPFNPEAASFQPRQPSSGHETTHPQKLEVTVINAHCLSIPPDSTNTAGLTNTQTSGGHQLMLILTRNHNSIRMPH